MQEGRRNGDAGAHGSTAKLDPDRLGADGKLAVRLDFSGSPGCWESWTNISLLRQHTVGRQADSRLLVPLGRHCKLGRIVQIVMALSKVWNLRSVNKRLSCFGRYFTRLFQPCLHSSEQSKPILRCLDTWNYLRTFFPFSLKIQCVSCTSTSLFIGRDLIIFYRSDLRSSPQVYVSLDIQR